VLGACPFLKESISDDVNSALGPGRIGWGRLCFGVPAQDPGGPVGRFLDGYRATSSVGSNAPVWVRERASGFGASQTSGSEGKGSQRGRCPSGGESEAQVAPRHPRPSLRQG
jgi:hypothetical protein